MSEAKISESKKTICLVVTNHDKLGDTGKKTGWYLPEVAHPFDIFTKAGYKIVFASPKGGDAPLDQGSVADFGADPVCKAFLEDKTSMAALKNTLKPQDVQSKHVDAIFFAGGHGPMYDMPQSVEMAKLASTVYEQGGFVVAVCHGPAGLLEIKLSDGSYLLKGKKVTGFSNKEEEIGGLTKVMPFLLEDEMKKRGGLYESAQQPWAPHVVVCQRLITGQNPASAHPAAETLVKELLGNKMSEAKISESKKTICLVVTNHDKLGDTGKKTGWYLPEVAHPFDIFTKAGYKIVFASPKGGDAPLDQGSVADFGADPVCKAFLEDKTSMAALKNTLKPQDVQSKHVDAIFFAGGHGPMYDMPQSVEMAKLASTVYEQGGFVVAVCHGPAGLLEIKLSDGSYLLKGKKVTGFSNKEEEIGGLTKVMPFLLEDEMKKRGGLYESAQQPWAPHVVVCQRLITGQNPASAHPAAETLAKELLGKKM